MPITTAKLSDPGRAAEIASVLINAGYDFLTEEEATQITAVLAANYVTAAELTSAIDGVTAGAGGATSEQGALADSAVQPEDITDVVRDADITDVVRDGDDVLEVAQVRTVSASTALVIEDRGRFVDATAAATITIPTNASVAFDVGSIVTVQRLGAGAVTITADTGVTLNGVSAGSGPIGTQWQGVSLRKIGADAWVASGDIEVA